MAWFTGSGWVRQLTWPAPSTRTTPRQPASREQRDSASDMSMATSSAPWMTMAGAWISPKRSVMSSLSINAR